MLLNVIFIPSNLFENPISLSTLCCHMLRLCHQHQAKALPLNAIKINWTTFISFQGGPESVMPDVSNILALFSVLSFLIVFYCYLYFIVYVNIKL